LQAIEQAAPEPHERGWQQLLEQHQMQDGSPQFVLTHEVWTCLPRSVQEAWVLEWVNEQLVADEVVPIPPAAVAVADALRPVVMKYSGRFPDASGANCFAATLALATGTLAPAEQIIHLWLHQEPFLRALGAQGYRPAREIHQGDKTDAITSLDALVWSNQEG